MPETKHNALIETVQRNCHISDARHGRDHTLCIYLLKMREYFRWEKGLAYSEPLPKDELGAWITAREAMWDDMERHDYSQLTVEGATHQPYDNQPINEGLNPQGLLYSGGVGTFAKPSFFLAELLTQRSVADSNIFVAGKELARDLSAYPAMSQGTTIIVRRESLKRFLWERIEEWRWKREDGPMASALDCYAFDSRFEQALEQMTENEIEAVILHELGEVQAGIRLGERWQAMLVRYARERRELIARAIRDHIADGVATLPELIAQQALPSLHFYFANFSGMRKAIYPELYSAYQRWAAGGNLSQMKDVVMRGADYWTLKGQQLVAAQGKDEEAVWQRLEQELAVGTTKKAPAA